MALAANFMGTDGPNEISGTRRADAIRGLGGNDRLSGSSGVGEVWCGSGTDYVYADVRNTVY